MERGELRERRSLERRRARLRIPRARGQGVHVAGREGGGVRCLVGVRGGGDPCWRITLSDAVRRVEGGVCKFVAELAVVIIQKKRFARTVAVAFWRAVSP